MITAEVPLSHPFYLFQTYMVLNRFKPLHDSLVVWFKRCPPSVIYEVNSLLILHK